MSAFTQPSVDGRCVVIDHQAAMELLVCRSHCAGCTRFLGDGWRTAGWDPRELGRQSLDLGRVKLVRVVEPGERRITGWEHLNRLRGLGHRRLGLDVFRELVGQLARLPPGWLEPGPVHFAGTIVRNPHGKDCLPCLYLFGSTAQWYLRGLEGLWDGDAQFAIGDDE